MTGRIVGTGHVLLACGHTTDEVPLAVAAGQLHCPLCRTPQDTRRVVDKGYALLTNRPSSETDRPGQ